LTKSERITKQFEFREVMRGGRLLTATTFRGYVLTGENLTRKAGFIAGKALGKANKRNRARRLLKEAYRLLKPSLPETGFKVGFNATPGINDAEFEDVKREMTSFFRKAGLIR